MSELLKLKTEDLDHITLTGAVEEQEGNVIVDPQAGLPGPLLQVPRDAIKAIVRTKEMACYSDGQERPICFVYVKRNASEAASSAFAGALDTCRI